LIVMLVAVFVSSIEAPTATPADLPLDIVSLSQPVKDRAVNNNAKITKNARKRYFRTLNNFCVN
jgi:hypothetical protein